MREPAAINNLVSEKEEIANRIRKLLPDELPQEVEALFNEWSDYFNEQVILRWREEKRFDELVDYLIYQYEIFDGHHPWEQVLLDLRLEKDESRATRLLEGLLKEREKRLRGTLSKLRENPDNLNLQVALTIHKASVLALLAEMEFIIANKPNESIDKAKVDNLRKRIMKVQAYGQAT